MKCHLCADPTICGGGDPAQRLASIRVALQYIVDGYTTPVRLGCANDDDLIRLLRLRAHLGVPKEGKL